MAAERIEVWLGYGASEKQGQEIRDIFAEENIPVEVRMEDDFPHEGNGAGFTIQVMLIGTTLGAFLTAYFGAAGKDAWEKTKSLLGKLKADHLERYPSEPPTAEGLVVFKEVDRRIQIGLTTDLPDEAYAKLSELEIGEQEETSYIWDDEKREWRAIDLSPYEDRSPRTRDDPDIADT